MATFPPQPPPASPTQDTADHHTSPVQAAAPQPQLTPIKAAKPPYTGTMRTYNLPDHVTKHPNPVGRPKNPRG